MLRLDRDSVDHVITDPPYDAHTHEAHRIGATKLEGGNAAISRNKELGFDPITAEEMALAAEHFERVAKRWTLVFCTLEQISAWKLALEGAGLEYIRGGVWRKIGSTPQFSGDRPATGVEAIVIAHRPGRKRWNGGGRHAVWDCPIELNRGGKSPRLHTTQKPLALMEALVRDFTDAGELVLDPFAGSGTTGVAALALGRRFVGWELMEKYHRVASERLAGTQEQSTLESIFGSII